MISQSLIIIPEKDSPNIIADYLLQTALVLAKNNRVIIVLLSQAQSLKNIARNYFFRKKRFRLIYKRRGITFVRPIHIIPFKRFVLIERLNQIIIFSIIRLLAFFSIPKLNRRVLWIFYPDFFYLPALFGKSYIAIYDIIDYFTYPDPILDKGIRRKEFVLLKNADVVTTISPTLKDLYAPIRKSITVVPQGFRLNDFLYAKMDDIDFPRFEKPVIGFVGAINERLNLSLLYKLAVNNNIWQFVFVGPKTPAVYISLKRDFRNIRKLLSLDNVFYLRRVSKKFVPTIIKRFDICIIPYDVSKPFNLYCRPMKLMEYFYMQKPVVSTPIDGLLSLKPLLRIGGNAREFSDHIRNILRHGWPLHLKQEQRRFAINNSWEKKIEVISRLVESKL